MCIHIDTSDVFRTLSTVEFSFGSRLLVYATCEASITNPRPPKQFQSKVGIRGHSRTRLVALVRAGHSAAFACCAFRICARQSARSRPPSAYTASRFHRCGGVQRISPNFATTQTLARHIHAHAHAHAHAHTRILLGQTRCSRTPQRNDTRVDRLAWNRRRGAGGNCKKHDRACFSFTFLFRHLRRRRNNTSTNTRIMRITSPVRQYLLPMCTYLQHCTSMYTYTYTRIPPACTSKYGRSARSRLSTADCLPQRGLLSATEVVQSRNS